MKTKEKTISRVLVTIYFEEGSFKRSLEEKEINIQYSLPIYSSQKNANGDFEKYPNQNPTVRILHKELIPNPCYKKILLTNEVINNIVSKLKLKGKTAMEKIESYCRDLCNDNHGKDFSISIID